MKAGGIACILILLGVMGVTIDAVAEPESNPSPALLSVEHKNTVTLNFGSYNIYKRNQDWKITGSYSCTLFCGYDSLPLPTEFDTTSRNVVGLEFERQFKHGFSYGLTYFQIKNSFAVPSLTPSHGTLDAKFYIPMIKKYFGDPGGFRSYIAVGLGQVRGDIGGYANVSSLTGGEAAQAVAGFRYLTGRIDFVAEYRYVRTTTMSLLNTNSGTGTVRGQIDLSGRGNFVGLGVRF